MHSLSFVPAEKVVCTHACEEGVPCNFCQRQVHGASLSQPPERLISDEEVVDECVLEEGEVVLSRV